MNAQKNLGGSERLKAKSDPEAPKQAPKEATKDAPKDAAKDAPKDATKDAGKNAAGGISKIVSASPYKVISCDQVVEVEASTLLDLNDFTKKGQAFYTMSAYMVNQFEKKDGNFLEKSITLDRIINMPSIIQGSVSCLGFFDTGKKYIAICPKDKKTANELLDAFGQFMKCRMGDSLRNTPASTVDNILKNSCLGLDVSFDIKKYGGDVNLAKAALQTAMNNALKNAAKNLKGNVNKEKDIPDENEVIDGNAKTIPQA